MPIWVQTTSAPSSASTSLRRQVALDGHGDPGSRFRLGDEPGDREEGLAVAEDDPGVVDQGELLPVRADHGTEVRAGRPHQLGKSCRASLPVETEHPGGRHERVDDEHIGAELGEHVRHDKARRAVGVVEDELQMGVAQRLELDARGEGRRVELARPRREVDVADLVGEHAAEVLAVIEPLDPLLGRLVDVDAVGVEEADDDGLGVVPVEADGEPALIRAGADVEPRERKGRGLEVLDVQPRRVEPDHHGALQHPGRPRRVPRGRDRRAPRQRRGVRHRDPRRRARAMRSTLARPGTPRRPNSARAPRVSQMIELVTVALDSTIL